MTYKKLTNEQAITVLDVLWYNPLFSEIHRQAFEIGIKAIRALEQEPCEDAISRQAVLNAMYALCDTGETLKENPWRETLHIDAVIETIEELLPVNPTKTGHWIDGKCSRCGTHAPYWAMATTYYCSEYCPNCGCKMEREG